MAIKVVKIVPNNFTNQSRDTREITTLIEMGCEVTIIIKEEGEEDYKGPLEPLMVRLSSRPLANRISNKLINRAYSFYLWVKEVRKQKADILSCHDYICLYIGWFSTLFQKKKPKLVYDSHEFEYESGIRKPFRKACFKYLERFIIKKCGMVMMVNDTIADEVQKLHHLKDRPEVVKNIPNYWHLDYDFIKTRKEDFRKEHGITDEEMVVLYQGGIIEGRGVEKAISAIAKINNTRLIIMGYGQPEYVQETKKLVSEKHVEDRVIFFPPVSQKELWKYTTIADIGLCTIENTWLSYYYSLPNKLFEYIQALVPVLGSDFPEIGRIVNGYKIGVTCNPDNVDSVVEGIYRLGEFIKNTDITNSLMRAKEELHWENEKKHLIEAYRKLIAKIVQ